MTVLVLGATGFLGPAILRALAGMGVEIAAASRTGAGPHSVMLDRYDPAAVLRIVRARKVAAVIDLLAFTEAKTLPLLTTLNGEVERWIMVSSGDVYRNYEGLHKVATPAVLPGPLAETSPLRRSRYPYRAQERRPPTAADAWMDDYDKIPLECAVRDAFGSAAVVLRLPMTYGPGDRQTRFRWIIAPMLAGAERISVFTDWAAWRTTYGFVDDVGDAIATAATHPKSAGHTFNIGEASARDHMGWIADFARVISWSGEVNLTDKASAGPLMDLNLSYTMDTDTRAFRKVCGWREPTSFDEALQRTIAAQKGA